MFELIANCNTMIAINQNSIDEIQEKHNHTTANIEKIDALISNVKDLDTRLDDTECTSADQLIKFEDEVVMDVETIKDTSKTFEKHLHSLDNRVSSIEHLCGIRSSSSSSSSGLDTSRDDSSIDTFSISSTTSADDMDMSISSDSSCVESDTEESCDSTSPPDSSPDSSYRREDVATELHYQHADEGLQDPIPIKVIMSLLEEHDDDTVATLRHMRSLESEYEYEDDGKKPRKKKSAKKKKKCIVFGCTSNTVTGMLKCSCHQYPCSITDCVKQGRVAIDDGTLYCISHARTEAPEAYNRWRQQKSCTILGCNKKGHIVSDSSRYCQRHARTEAPEAYAQYLANLHPCSILDCNNRSQLLSNNGASFCLPHARTEAPEAYAQYRERRNRRWAERYRTDPKFRLRMLLRRRLIHALKAQGTSYQGKLKFLGCSVDQFKRYLAQFFRESGNDWMDWGNHGRQEGVRCWEVDHIMPLSSFKNLKDPEQLRRAQHWSNFQPLSAADNNDKRAKRPDGFEWNGDRWMWSEDSGRTNYNLP